MEKNYESRKQTFRVANLPNYLVKRVFDVEVIRYSKEDYGANADKSLNLPDEARGRTSEEARNNLVRIIEDNLDYYLKENLETSDRTELTKKRLKIHIGKKKE